MTQQYIVGELSALLGELQPAPGKWLVAVDDLRREVESSPLAALPQLADKALRLADEISWAALDSGDVSGFCRYATTADALEEFTANAGLLP